MALTANEIRALQALRAPGGITTEQAWERWPTTGTKALHELVRKGFATDVDERFLITMAGRAACPPVNPLLAVMPAKPKESAMTMQCHSYKDVVAAIAAAGPSGLTRKQLADTFTANSRADLTRIDAHIFYALTKVHPPAIAKIKPGHYVAAEFAPEQETVETKLQAAIKRITTPATAPAEVPEAEVEQIARDYAEMSDREAWSRGTTGDATAERDAGAPAAAAVNKMLDALPKLGSEARASLPATEDTASASPIERCERTLQFDQVHGAELDVAVWSSGAMTIVTDEITVEFDKAAVRKLRAFLGLFAEAA